MAEVEFLYNGKNVNIICNLNEKMNDIFNQFIKQTQIDKTSIDFFYQGKIIDEELKLKEIIKEKNKIQILVNTKKELKNNKDLIKKPINILCPICHEIIRIAIKDFKIKLYDCKNFHRINNILLDEFENIEKIRSSEIKCNKCGKNKNPNNNEIYRCLKCKMNLCSLCKSIHDEKHDIINYEQKNYICEKHNEILIKYCNNCKQNICMSCSNEHKNHNTIYYDNINPDIDKIKEEIKELKKEI